ncbi:MAG TPA: hypothetical protein PLO92_09565, partial [Anaerolineaceae bacterium]|nr:hypothetical protein [Anaerolineaceae bacterium]
PVVPESGSALSRQPAVRSRASLAKHPCAAGAYGRTGRVVLVPVYLLSVSRLTFLEILRSNSYAGQETVRNQEKKPLMVVIPSGVSIYKLKKLYNFEYPDSLLGNG